TDVDLDPSELFGAGKLWCPGKATRGRNRGLRTWLIDSLSQAEVDDFCGHRASFLQVHHDVAWFDIPVNELLLVHRGQAGRDLRCNFHRQLYLKSPGSFDEALERFSLDKLHRVEVIARRSSQV